MKLLMSAERDQKGALKEQISGYKPSEKIKARFSQINRDFQVADQVRHQAYEEFDFKSLVDVLYESRMRYNENTPSRSDDPADSWKSDVIRPLTRNKVRALAAHVTQTILYPIITAQNEDDKEDRDMSIVMRDCVEWVLERDNYSEKFIDIAIDMLTEPAAIVYQGYADVKRKVKEITDKDAYTIKEVVDEIYSGFKLMHVPVEDLYIANVYEPDIQKQPFVIWHRYVDYYEAKAKYGHLPDFKYVKAGFRTQFSVEDDVFFDKKDEELEDRLVEEVVYYNRLEDLELTILGGVMIHSDPDRPLQRKDKLIPFATNGFERYATRFFYFKSLVSNLKGLQDEVDLMHRMVIDGTFLRLMPPLAVYGDESFDNSVFIPGVSLSFQDPNTRVEALNPGFDISSGLSVLQKLESEASESSASEFISGTPLTKEATKFELNLLQQNAATKLGLFGKRVAFFVRDIGRLTVGSITQHMPLTEISEISGEGAQMKFAAVLIQNREVEGQQVSRRIEFEDMEPMAPEQMEQEEFKLLSQEATIENNKLKMHQSIMRVNKKLFKRMKYLVKVEPDYSDRLTKFMKKMQFYDRAVRNPAANQAEVLRFMAKEYVPGEEDKFVMVQQVPGNPNQPSLAQGSEFEM